MYFADTFIDESEHYSALVETGYEFAVRFNALSPFSAFRYVSPVMAENGGTLELSLYKFDADYRNTKSKAPLETGRFDLACGTEFVLNFASQGAGEYLLVAHDGTRGAGFCGLMGTRPDVQLYINGLACDGSMEASVGFDSECGAYFGALSEEAIPEKAIPAEANNDFTPSSYRWSATDGLGRALSSPPLAERTPKKRSVGLFFWDWHYHFDHGVPMNVNAISKAHPEAKNDFNSPVWGDPANTTYFHWNEPVWGYYTSTDKYVLRKQAQMLCDAGVDFIVFDNTNGTYTWKIGYETVFETFAEARKEGVRTPQIVFMLNFAPFRSSWVMLRQIYTDIYRNGRYSDLWYMLDGKPLVIGHNECFDPQSPLDAEILDFFTFRKNDPIYFTKEPTPPKTWGWLSVNPQARYCVRDDGSCEQMTVGVAQNASERGLVPMNDINGGVFGRSHTFDPNYSYTYDRLGKTVRVDSRIENSHFYGLNFQEQWERAIDADPDIVFVTGWNEWVAGRHPEWQGSPNAFPDTFNDEYSRDIEPTKGDLKDNYYMQLVANIRAYKRQSTDLFPCAELVDGDWSAVEGQRHSAGSSPKRDNDGWRGTHYTDDSARNVIVETKIAQDDGNIIFYARCAKPITPSSDADWMRLLISTDTSDGWEGFDLIVNRDAAGVVERSVGGWNWERVGAAELTTDGDVIVCKLPKSLLPEKAETLRYKWADNNLSNGDVLDLYTTGCTVPQGRFTISVKIK